MKVITFGDFFSFEAKLDVKGCTCIRGLETLPQECIVVLKYVVGRRPEFLTCVRVEGLTSVLLLSGIVELS